MNCIWMCFSEEVVRLKDCISAGTHDSFHYRSIWRVHHISDESFNLCQKTVKELWMTFPKAHKGTSFGRSSLEAEASEYHLKKWLRC